MTSKTKALRDENNALDEQLTSTNNEVVTNMVVYIRSFFLSDYKQEMVRHDIIQMVLDGQNRGETIEEVIGEDYKEFCDNILHEMPKPSKWQSILSGLSLICLLKAILTGIWFVTSLTEALDKNKTWPFIPVYLGTLFSAFIIVGAAIFIVYYICRNAFVSKKDKNTSKLIIPVVFIAILSGILSRFIFRETAILQIHFAIIILFILCFFILHKGIDIYLESKEAGVL